MKDQKGIESACDNLEDQIEVLEFISNQIRLYGGIEYDVAHAIEHLRYAIRINTTRERNIL